MADDDDDRSCKRQCLPAAAAAAAASREDGPSRDEDPGSRNNLFHSSSRSSSIPSEAIQHILSFLDFADRQALAATSKGGLREVEAYSNRLYTNIKKEHEVDETFDDRVCDQTSIETKRAKPVFLPYRYRVSKSMNTWLYKIDAGFHINKLLLSPSERCLLAVPFYGGSTVIYNFSTKRLTTVIHSTHTDMHWLDDSRIVMFNEDDCIRNYREDSVTGNWHTGILPRTELLRGTVVGQTKLSEGEIFAFIKDNTTESSRTRSVAINVNDGRVKNNFFIEGSVDSIGSSFIAYSDDNQKWLLFYGYKRSGSGDQRNEGLHIYNCKTNKRSQFLPGAFWNLKQVLDCSKTFFWTNGDPFAMLELGQDGCLSERNSFPVDRDFVAASKKQIKPYNKSTLRSYDTATGLPNRSLSYFNVICPPFTISNTRKQLLV